MIFPKSEFTTPINPAPAVKNPFNRYIPFPARCGVRWSATKIFVFVNAELPKMRELTGNKNYGDYLKIAMQPNFSNKNEPNAGSPSNPNVFRRHGNVRRAATRQSSIDGRFQNPAKFKPLKTILQDITDDFNLSRLGW